MGKVFEDSAVLSEQLVEHSRAIMLIPAPKDMMMRPFDNANGIELDETKLIDDPGEVQLSCWHLSQAMGM